MNQTKDIVAAIAKHLAVTPADIDINASLETDLGLGPLEKADLYSDLSQQFSVTFSPEDLENVETVHDLVVLVEDLLLE